MPSPVPLVVATTNRAKAREIVRALGEEELGWKTLDDYPPVAQPEETGTTFAENAAIKALYYMAHTGQVTLAEDSGLEVDALDGRPGVYSARYAGAPCDDDANNAKVLAELEGLPPDQRGARFRSSFVLALPDGRLLAGHGAVAGTIAHACAGTNGFGYDAIFVPEGYEPTFGQLDPSVKRAISHRARALRALMTKVRALAIDSAGEA